MGMVEELCALNKEREQVQRVEEHCALNKEREHVEGVEELCVFFFFKGFEGGEG